MDPFDPTIAHNDAPPASAAPAEPESELPRRFPWPPAEGESILTAFTDTCFLSLARPVSFFRAMPAQGIGAALSFSLPISIIAAGFHLLWASVFDAVGIDDLLRRLLGQQATVDTAMERLLGFLFTPITSVLVLFIGAAVVQVSLKVLGAARKPYQSTLRVLAFSATPQLFAIVPVLGTLIAAVWGFVLAVIGLREVQETSTGRAVAALLLPIFLVSFLLVGAMAVLTVLVLAVGAR